MWSRYKLLFTILPAALAGACIGMNPKSVAHLENRGDAFDRALHAEYAELAIKESELYDWSSATRFAHKAEAAAAGTPVAPEMPEIWGISGSDAGVIERARASLIASLERDAIRTRSPDTAAAAQAAFDCWVEETSEGQAATIEKCRDRWQTAMADLDLAAPPVMLPAAAPVVRVESPERYEVFFGPGSATLDASSRKRIEEVLAEHLTSHTGPIRVVGHTDRVGPADLNEQIAWSRASTVADALVAAGVEQIDLLSLGEAAPAVPTADEVAHPLNRRTVIELL